MGKWLEEGTVPNRPESTSLALYSLNIIGSLRDESLWKVHVELSPIIIRFLLPSKHANDKDHSWRHLISHWNYTLKQRSWGTAFFQPLHTKNQMRKRIIWKSYGFRKYFNVQICIDLHNQMQCCYIKDQRHFLPLDRSVRGFWYPDVNTLTLLLQILFYRDLRLTGVDHEWKNILKC